MVLFSDLKNKFKIIDFSPSHDQLLLRSMKNKRRTYNIDIIVKGVGLVLCPTALEGIEISLLKDIKTKASLLNKYGLAEKADCNIFMLRSSSELEFYINAMCFGVYHNKLDILESSIGRYDFENFDELIIWYADS